MSKRSLFSSSSLSSLNSDRNAGIPAYESKKSQFLKPVENRYRMASLENRDGSDTASQKSSTFSAKQLMMTPRIENKSKFTPIHKPNYEKKMREFNFVEDQVYMGFSSRKREDIIGRGRLADECKSEIYKEEEPIRDFTQKTFVQKRASNPLLSSIRNYNDSRSEFLGELGKCHTRSSTSIFGLQKSSFN